ANREGSLLYARGAVRVQPRLTRPGAYPGRAPTAPAARETGDDMADEAWSAEQFRQKYEEQAAKIGRFNLAVFGKTGVGKSTLINAVFGEDVAPTGIGEPVTMDGHLYVHRSGFLGLYDTRGLEIGNDT